MSLKKMFMVFMTGFLTTDVYATVERSDDDSFDLDNMPQRGRSDSMRGAPTPAPKKVASQDHAPKGNGAHQEVIGGGKKKQPAQEKRAPGGPGSIDPELENSLKVKVDEEESVGGRARSGAKGGPKNIDSEASHKAKISKVRQRLGITEEEWKALESSPKARQRFGITEKEWKNLQK